MRRNVTLRLLALSRPFWRGMTLAALLGTLTVTSSISLMATSAWLISKAALQPSIAELSVAVVGVRFFGLARGLFRYLERLIAHEVTFRLLARLRVGFYRAVEPLAPAGLIDLRSGDLLSRVVKDIDSLQDLYLRAVAPAVVSLVIAFFLTLFLSWFHPLLGLTALIFMLSAAILVPLLVWWLNGRVGSRRVTHRAELSAALVDSIQGMAETIMYGRAADQTAAIGRLNDRLAEADQQYALVDAVQVGLNILLASGAALGVLLIAIPRIDGIYLATVALATVAAFEAFAPLAQAALQFSTMHAAGRRLFAIIDAPPPVADSAAAGRVTLPLESPPLLDIRDLSFRYTADGPFILQDLNLRLEPGQRIAILGPSGAGKSTLVNVLLRFWDYPEGQILLGGRDLRSYALADVRALFGVMTQRTYLFNTSIRENLRIARPDASDLEIEQAARQAEIHDFICTLPDGYGTEVGENGAQLSGGERQRIALARVLLKGSPILILDEATANLDAVTERRVMETILNAATGKSLLIFTHRRVLLERMDQVIRIENAAWADHAARREESAQE